MLAPVLLTTLLASLVLASGGEPRNVVPWIGGYSFVVGPMTWNAADAACSAVGWHLALPQTGAEFSALMQLMYANGASQAHIGFHDLFVEGEYFTVLGQSLAQVGVQHGSLAVDDDADCGSLDGNGFRTVMCNETLPAICQQQAGANYDLVAGFGYYKLSTVRATWTEAVLACRAEGADLLVMHSEEEYNALIKRYLNMQGGYFVHYGAHHVFTDQRFVTLFGEPLERTGFAMWEEYPNLGSNLERPYLGLIIPVQGRDRGLSLLEPNFEALYICKRPLHE